MIQREGTGDRHMLVVDPTNRMLYEFYQRAQDRHAAGPPSQSSIFDLKTNKLRPDGWTSTDAAGLPIFPAVVRYDELERGMVEHAMRFTIRNITPGVRLPGDPLRQQQDRRRTCRGWANGSGCARISTSRGFPPHAQAILKGLKKYGMFVADNGGDWRISVAPDGRIKGLDDLRRVKGSDFEVVEPDARPAP